LVFLPVLRLSKVGARSKYMAAIPIKPDRACFTGTYMIRYSSEAECCSACVRRLRSKRITRAQARALRVVYDAAQRRVQLRRRCVVQVDPVSATRTSKPLWPAFVARREQYEREPGDLAVCELEFARVFLPVVAAVLTRVMLRIVSAPRDYGVAATHAPLPSSSASKRDQRARPSPTALISFSNAFVSSSGFDGGSVEALPKQKPSAGLSS
jgi:hypothetical protein